MDGDKTLKWCRSALALSLALFFAPPTLLATPHSRQNKGEKSKGNGYAKHPILTGFHTNTHTHKHVRVLPFFAKGSKKAGQPGHDDINARMYEEGSKTYASPVSHIRLRFPS